MEIPYKIYLEESEMPKAWYNVRADMKNKPAPLLNPGTGKPGVVALEFVVDFVRDLHGVLLLSVSWEKRRVLP